MSTDIRGMIIFYSIYMKVVSVLPAIFIFCYPGPLDRDRSLEEKKKVSGPEGEFAQNMPLIEPAGTGRDVE